jgi:hypothetical protein
MRSTIPVAILISFTYLLRGQEPASEQVTIESTGSTNAPGVKLLVSPSGSAEVQPRHAEARRTTVKAELANRLFEDLKSIGPLSALPPVHCIKSVSFGTSLYVEYEGERSPDLNCPVDANSKLGTLQKDARELMQAAHAKPRAGPRPKIVKAPRSEF